MAEQDDEPKDQAHKDMATVTAYDEDNQIAGNVDNLDFLIRKAQEKTPEQLDLEKLTLSDEEVQYLMEELDITKLEAVSLLRKSWGKVQDAVQHFMNDL